MQEFGSAQPAVSGGASHHDVTGWIIKTYPVGGGRLSERGIRREGKTSSKNLSGRRRTTHRWSNVSGFNLFYKGLPELISEVKKWESTGSTRETSEKRREDSENKTHLS